METTNPFSITKTAKGNPAVESGYVKTIFLAYIACSTIASLVTVALTLHNYKELKDLHANLASVKTAINNIPSSLQSTPTTSWQNELISDNNLPSGNQILNSKENERGPLDLSFLQPRTISGSSSSRLDGSNKTTPYHQTKTSQESLDDDFQ